jgi:hypothetical protein
MSRRPFLLLLTCGCLHALAAACAFPDDCTVGDARCAGSKVQSCRRTSNVPNFPVPGATAASSANQEDHGSSAPSWIDEQDCGRADLCVQQGPQNAFCTVSHAAEPACASRDPEALACDQGALVVCNYGYVVEKYACHACQTNPSCSATFPEACCPGMLGSSCAADSDCAPGLTCDSSQCTHACSCSDGSVCDACRPYFDSSRGDVLYPVCSSGRCMVE